MKWKAFQRDDLAEAQPVHHADRDRALSHGPVVGSLPLSSTFATVTQSVIPLATASDPSNTARAGSCPFGSTLLISNDIEALLKEDEKRRGNPVRELAYSGSADSSMDYPSYEDSGVPIIGLPAPPRRRRKSSPRARRQPSELHADGSFVRTPEQPPVEMQRAEKAVENILAQENDDTLMSLSAFGPTGALHAPAIGDLALDNSSPLGIEVMNALNSRQLNDTYRPTDAPEKQRSVFPEPLLEKDLSLDSSALGKGNVLSTFSEEGRQSSRVFSRPENSNEHDQEDRDNDREKLTENARTTQPAASTPSPSEPLLPTRTFLTHAHSGSRDSDFSHTTYSSLDPPSTTYEPRISISSTIYPPSTCNSLPPPVPVPSSSSPRQDDQFRDRRASSLMAYSAEAESIAPEALSQSRQELAATDHDSDPVLVFPIPTEPETLLTPKFANREDISSSDNSPIDFGAGSLLNRDPESEVGTEKVAVDNSRLARKPALPTAPKPNFRRSCSVQPVSKTPRVPKPPSPTSSPKLASLIPYHLLTSLGNVDQGTDGALPPTTNNLNPQERAELVRKTRKLTQLFGRTPSPITGGTSELPESPIPNNCLLPMIPTRKAHPRGALSTSDALQVAQIVKGIRERQSSPLTPAAKIKSSRDSPLSPMTFRSSFLANDDSDSEASLSPIESPAAQTPESSQRKNRSGSVTSPAIITAADSFMDLAGPDQAAMPQSPSSFSITESLTDSQKAEDERRRKRERLAKLHRFLGSRIPSELILGPHEMGVPLPAPAPRKMGYDDIQSDNDSSSPAKLWARGKRRNSLASSDPTHWLADSERMKEDLKGQQKAIIVKRAQKMEKMFGEQPPQSLFFNRQSVKPGRGLELSSSAPTSPVGRNINRSAYRKGKASRRKDDRPGTAESRKGLISSTGFKDASPGKEEMSQVYLHYRHSLISLTNIVDNDDRASLAELHEYINGGSTYTADRRSKQRSSIDKESRSSLHSERRRSLPHQSSFSSLASQYTISGGRTEASPFEVRRRRAAKLSHFFGVGYRDLFGEVLDSIEMGVREDEDKGTLNPDEAQDLLAQLKRLKKRRDDLI